MLTMPYPTESRMLNAECGKGVAGHFSGGGVESSTRFGVTLATEWRMANAEWRTRNAEGHAAREQGAMPPGVNAGARAERRGSGNVIDGSPGAKGNTGFRLAPE